MHPLPGTLPSTAASYTCCLFGLWLSSQNVFNYKSQELVRRVQFDHRSLSFDLGGGPSASPTDKPGSVPNLLRTHPCTGQRVVYPVLTRLTLHVLPPIVDSLLTDTVLRPFSNIGHHRVFLETIGGSSEDILLTQFIGDAVLAV